jgi:DNA-binding MarR family transcriptional regulator
MALLRTEFPLAMPAAEEAPVRRTLGFLLEDAGRLMRRRYLQRSQQQAMPINRSEAKLLLHLAHAHGMSQAKLADLMDVEPITLAKLLDRLQASGLIERRAHPVDRRIRTIWLTQAAEPVILRIRGVTLAVREEALAGFPPEQREALFDMLVALRQNLVTATDSPDPLDAPA